MKRRSPSRRGASIESLMRGASVEHETSPLIATSWSDAWRTRRSIRFLLSVLSWPHVFLPHAVVFVGGLIAWLVNLRLHFVG